MAIYRRYEIWLTREGEKIIPYTCSRRADEALPTIEEIILTTLDKKKIPTTQSALEKIMFSDDNASSLVYVKNGKWCIDPDDFELEIEIDDEWDDEEQDIEIYKLFHNNNKIGEIFLDREINDPDNEWGRWCDGITLKDVLIMRGKKIVGTLEMTTNKEE